MASADMAAPGRQQPPTNLNLSSNNPFRNRLSMQPPSPQPRSNSMGQSSQQFPFPAGASKNPFLDPQEASPAKKSPAITNTAEVEDIFRDMSMSTQNERPAGPPSPPKVPIRAGPPPTQQRPLGPEERRDRPLRPFPSRPAPDSPQKRPTEHRRRASESSMMEYDKRERGDRPRTDRPPRTESEERRRRERRREREERYKREGKELPSSSSRSRKMRNLDLIDKLDVTGVYGQGLFHHDGPFDACNPSRNAKKDRRAPMQAFPEGSANMALGGAGPNRSRLDLDKFHGRTEEGFNDFSATRKADTTYQQPQSQERIVRGEPVLFSTTDRGEVVHGVETNGLGTSTFLEGAPASKSALLQRRESEDQAVTNGNGGGLQRKKSLAQRLRGMSASRPRNPEASRSPEARYNGGPVELTDGPAPKIPATTITNGSGSSSRGIYTQENEVNVFDNEYDRAFEKKGAEIRWAERERPVDSSIYARQPGSPGLHPNGNGSALYRSVTADAAMPSPTEDKPTGFLSRMKSLKGPRKPRTERKDSYA